MPTVTERIEALEKKVAELEGQLQARRDPIRAKLAFLIASGFIRNEEEYHSFLAQHKAMNDTDLAKKS